MRGSTKQTAGMEETAAVVVCRRQRVCRVGRNWVMSRRGLRIHRRQAAPKRTGSFHLHTVR